MLSFMETDFNFTTSDSVKLDGRLYFPSDGSLPTSYPVIVIRTDEALSAFHDFCRDLSLIGFAVYLQNVRGRGISGGRFFPFSHERQDGTETLEWISKQTWCNGKILLYGEEYSGQNALSAAISYNEIAGLCLCDSGGDIFKNGICLNGIPANAWYHQALHWACTNPETDTAALQPLNQKLLALSTFADIDGHPAISKLHEWHHYPEICKWLQDVPCFDAKTPDGELRTLIASRYSGMINENDENGLPDIPSCLIANWHHLTSDGTIRLFQNMLCRKSAPTVLHLIHKQLGDMTASRKIALDWFSAWFHRDTAANDWREKSRGVHFQAVNSNDAGFHKDAVWPPLEGQTLALFPYDKRLIVELPKLHEETISFMADGNHATPGVGGLGLHHANQNSGCLPQNFTDIKFPKLDFPLISRKDVITFTSAPLKHDMLISGTPRCRFTISLRGFNTSSAIALVATLMDASPDTASDATGFNISMGIIRVNQDEKRPLQYLEIPLHSIAYLVPANHRLQLMVTTGHYPNFSCINQMPCMISLHTGGSHASQITIPFLK